MVFAGRVTFSPIKLPCKQNTGLIVCNIRTESRKSMISKTCNLVS